MEHLLDCGAWINDRGGDRCGGVTPLIDAANCGNLDVVRLLVDRGANLMAKDDDVSHGAGAVFVQIQLKNMSRNQSN